MIVDVCNDFDLDYIAETIRNCLDRDNPDLQMLTNVRTLMEQCVMAARSNGKGCVAARTELKRLMNEGWLDRWAGSHHQTSLQAHGPGGARLAKIGELLSESKLEEAKTELQDMAKDLPSRRGVAPSS